MSIYNPGPVIMHEGAGFQRGGTQSVARGSKRPADRIVGRRPVRRIAPKVAVQAHTRAGRQIGPHVRRYPKNGPPVIESESNANAGVASFHTSQVNAPLGYQGLFYGH